MNPIVPQPKIIQQLPRLTDPLQFTAAYRKAKQRHEAVQPLRSYQFSLTLTTVFLGAIAIFIASTKNPLIIPYLLITTASLILLPPVIELCLIWKRVKEECQLFNLLKAMQLQLRYAWQAKSDALCECTSSYDSIPVSYRDSKEDVLAYIEILSTHYNTLHEGQDLFNSLSPLAKLWRISFAAHTYWPAKALAEFDLKKLPSLPDYVPHFSYGLNTIKEEAAGLFKKPSSILDPDKTPSFVKLEYNTDPSCSRVQTKPWVLGTIPHTYLKVAKMQLFWHSFFHIDAPLIYQYDVAIKTKQDKRQDISS